MEEHKEAEDNLGDSAGVASVGKLRRIMRFLLSPNADRKMAGWIFVILMLTPLSRVAMTFAFSGNWQISGYYLDGIFFGLLFIVALAWLVSVFALFATREIKRAIVSVITFPVIVLFLYVIAFVPCMFLFSNISGWPLDSVYSQSADKYYILAYGPGIDITYDLFSVSSTRLDPVWHQELPDLALDQTADGSLIDNPHLILSEDEQLLVVAKGGQLTDAVLLSTHQPVTEPIFYDDDNREQLWHKRTKLIKALLDAHNRPPPPPATPATPATVLTNDQIKAKLQAWCEQIVSQLIGDFADDGLEVSCLITEYDEPEKSGILTICLDVTCSNDDVSISFYRRISIVQDLGRLLVVAHDTDFSWMGDQKTALSKRVRNALLKYTIAGTYLD